MTKIEGNKWNEIILILGAYNSAGLTAVNKLLQYGIKSFLVLERESEAGGLCQFY